jgi:uncharacterized membrane protein
VPGPERTTLHVALGIVASYASPLPPAHELERLEKIQPGSLERLMTLQERVMTMAEGEQTHRHGIENADSHRMDLGQRFAFGGLAVLVVATVILGAIGQGGAAKVLGGTTVGVVGLFVVGRWWRSIHPATPPGGSGDG